MLRALATIAFSSLTVAWTMQAVPAGATNAAQITPLSRNNVIQTHVRVPDKVAVPLGEVADITVQVDADHSSQTPTGYVALWNIDIPSAVKVVSHAVGLDRTGSATFQLKETAPGVPFQVPNLTIYYVPTPGSAFAASTSPVFTLEMDRWPVVLSTTIGDTLGNGLAVPVQVSVSGSGNGTPVGDLNVSDTTAGGTCTAVLPGAFLYSSRGNATVNVDMPAGQNSLNVTYLGDAYFGQQETTSSVDVISGGRPDGTCAAGWAQLAPPPMPTSRSISDLPMERYGFPRRYGLYDPKPLLSPDVGTLVVQLDWSDIEPSPGVFDFAQADAEVQAAVAQGKQIALVLRFQSGSILSGTSQTCGWNFGHAQLMPKWVANTLGNADSFCSHGTALTIPKYWGAPFLNLWTTYVTQVADHFAPDATSIAYVRAPVGLGDEAVPITGPNFKPTGGDTKHLAAWGYNPQLWIAWQEDMLAFYKQAFSYAPWVLYTVNHQSVNNQCGDSEPVIATNPALPTFVPRPIGCTGNPAEVDVAEWAVDNGFGLAQNSLDPSWIWRDPNKADPPAGSINRILNYAEGHSPQPFVELQTFQADSFYCDLAVPSGLPPCSTNHSAVLNAEQDISYAHVRGVSAIEWYEQDLTNPKLQPVINLWRQIQAIPGNSQLPTVVTVTPPQASVPRGTRLAVSVTVSAPGIQGFIPAGTVRLTDDITGKLLKVVQVPMNQGTVNFKIKVPSTKYSHLNLSAAYVDAFKYQGHLTGTWLWLPSVSAIARVDVHG